MMRNSPQPTINKSGASAVQSPVETVCRGGTAAFIWWWVAFASTWRRRPTLLGPAIVGIWLEATPPHRFCLAAGHALQPSACSVVPSRAEPTQPPRQDPKPTAAVVSAAAPGAEAHGALHATGRHRAPLPSAITLQPLPVPFQTPRAEARCCWRVVFLFVDGRHRRAAGLRHELAEVSLPPLPTR